jgi:hypothetical protein
MDEKICANCLSHPAVPGFKLGTYGFCSANCESTFLRAVSAPKRDDTGYKLEPRVANPEVFQITADAFRMKQYLRDLAAACEEKVGPAAKESVKIVGADIVRLLTTTHGEKNNLEAIASVTRVLLYILDETEKRSMQTTSLKQLTPQGGIQ